MNTSLIEDIYSSTDNIEQNIEEAIKLVQKAMVEKDIKKVRTNLEDILNILENIVQ